MSSGEVINKHVIEAKREAIAKRAKNSNGRFQEKDDPVRNCKRIIQRSGK